MATQLNYEERKNVLNDIIKLVSTLRAGIAEDYEVSVGAIVRNANTLKCDLDAFPPITDRKIIQVETCPVNTINLDETTNTQNAVFALCDDGTLWMQLIGGGGNWTPIDGVPQGDFEEINQEEGSAD